MSAAAALLEYAETLPGQGIGERVARCVLRDLRDAHRAVLGSLTEGEQ